MDSYAEFQWVSIDATVSPPAVRPAEQRRERVDLVARQFRDFLLDGDPRDAEPHSFPLTPEFKIARLVTPNAAWLSLQVDVGDGRTEQLSEVVQMLLVREGAAPADLVLRLPEGVTVATVAEPTAHVVQTAAKVPFMIRDWLMRPAAGFFGERR